jgi:O-antigen/teichoic acid export membrane protein
VALATSIIVARAAGPEGKGALDLTLATALLLSTLFGLSLNSGITYVVARRAAMPRRLLVRLLGFVVAQGIGTAALLTAISQTSLSEALLAHNVGADLIVPISVLVMLLSLTGYFRAVLVGWQRFISANWRDLAGRLTTLAIIVAVVLLASSAGRATSALELVWASVAGAATVALILLVAIVPGLRREPVATANARGSGVVEAIRFALPAYSGNLAQFLNYRLDLFLVGLFLGIRGVGLYALAVSLCQLLWILSNSAAAVLFPRVSSVIEQPEVVAAESAQICRVVFGLTVVGGAGMAIVATVLLPLVYGQAFQPSVEPLLWLLPGIVAFSVTNVLASFMAGVGRPGLNAAVSILGVAVTVPLDLVLIPRLGITGAALASTISYSISTFATLAVFSRLGRIPLGAAVIPRRSDAQALVAFVRQLRVARAST